MIFLLCFIQMVFSACDTFANDPCTEFRMMLPADIDSAYVGTDDQSSNDAHHMVARGTVENDILHLFLPGTTAGPADYAAYMEYTVDKVEAVIGLAYVWGPLVGETNGVCNGMEDPSVCWYKYHEYIMHGQVMEESSSFVPASFSQNQIPTTLDDASIYNPDNAAVPRLVALLNYLAAEDAYWSKWMNLDGTLKWDKFVISGHSQGACHTSYLAHEYEIARAVIHSGPGEENVEWMTDFSTPTFEGRFWGVTSYNDPWRGDFLQAWANMTTLTYTYSGEPNPNYAAAYHGSTLNDREFPCTEMPLTAENCPDFVPYWDQMFDFANVCLGDVCESCEDNADFTDAHGHSCGDWKGFDCTLGTFDRFVYTEDELADIQSNCCDSCSQYTEDVLGLNQEKCNWHSQMIPCYYWTENALVAEYDMNYAQNSDDGEVEFIEPAGSAHEVTFVPGGNVWVT